jgi:hypothetical protein
MVAKKNEQNSLLEATGDLFDPNLDPDRFDGIHLVTSDEEAWEIFDSAARRELGISGEEFLRRVDSGEYEGMTEETLEERRIVGMMMLLPFARPRRG